jgi:squalene-hopene/tetraprenyl-beta-curcumene cyclase
MNLHVDLERIRVAHKTLRAELMAERTAAGHWVGELASSPSATATAISALVIAHQNDAGLDVRDLPVDDRQFHSQDILQSDLSEVIVESLHWLARLQNEDGGWGDATGARSNLAATMLVRAAFRLTGVPAKYDQLTERAEHYIVSQGGVAGLRRISKDRLIAVPVLANCALAGLIPWRQVPALPFEWTCVPHGWHRPLGLSVPSHAIPLLVAVGQVKFHHDPPHNPARRLVRYAARTRSLAVAQAMSPEQGGFLDSTQWTAFIVMSLASTGLQNHPLVESGLEFLLSSMRSNASWPIHSNLATWNTTLAVNALSPDSNVTRDQANTDGAPKQLASHNAPPTSISAAWQETLRNGDTVIAKTRPASTRVRGEESDDDEVLDQRCLDWLLACQHNKPQPITGGLQGGWGWSDLPGALPNTDDTAGALLALSHWWSDEGNSQSDRAAHAARLGVEWLLATQNDNGGWPMFCRGPSTALLARGACDLSAHALQALVVWHRLWKTGPRARSRDVAARSDRIVAAVERGLEFLEIEQRGDGSFPALRFGNEHHPDGQNLVYGTSQVLRMCSQIDLLAAEMARRAARWLLSAQHACGGWGPPRTPLDYSGQYKKNGSQSWRANPALEKFCSVEETALAVDALLPFAPTDEVFARAAHQGLNWLVNAVEQDRHRQPAVIGMHFTRLWYHERLYPLVFAAGALSRAIRQFAPSAVGGPIVMPVG